MIDNIIMIKKNLSDAEIKQIVKTSRLLEQSVNGLKAYNNGTTKNFDGGFFIKIETDKTLKITGSLHKYYSFLNTKSLTNFDSFTMHQAKETIIKMIENIGFEPENTNINYYEVGLNLAVNIEPKKILQNICSIGTIENTKEMFYNPKYKHKSIITTEFHRDFRVYHKAYDKIFEMNDKKKQPPTDAKIIRIETTNRRVEKILLLDFFKNENLQIIQNRFFSNWDKLNFYNDIDAPIGTHKSKIELAKEIIYKGKNEVLIKYLEQYNNNVLSIKMYYTIKRFIENWENEKFKYKSKKTEIFTYWETVYNTEKQIYNKNKSN
ncbi:hypothetical protein [Flavobacterium psychrophilum]|uniref:Uncharacterized protein n=1 Tax=Flavobacterium psychrophilum TaxID=96345 RepID=A0A7U2R9P1_FLAPS|nr:hypothetical protein [Flavobacterium psychrophilum]OAE92122.1 hypothetical protein SU65_10220 [Flavobacterium psychrophilum]QRE04190.1 hypothetical protein H0H26_00865 [Flavobacterium psychrophilum]